MFILTNFLYFSIFFTTVDSGESIYSMIALQQTPLFESVGQAVASTEPNFQFLILQAYMSKLLTILYFFGLPGSFLIGITTYHHRRNWTSWTYHTRQGIKT